VIAFERLVMLARGELAEPDAAETEEHVLACTGCANVLEQLLDLGERLGALVRAGAGGMLAGPEIVGLLEREKLVTRSYRIPPGSAVACTVDARDLYTAIHLTADLHGIARIDLVHEAPSRTYRVNDVPFTAGVGEIVFVQPGVYLRTLPTERKTLRLLAVDDAGERVIGEYVLEHTAFGG
jgi:hypothetical protein